MVKIMIIVIVATLVGLVVLQFIDPNSNISLLNPTTSDDDSDDTTGSFTIKGYVVNPGTYLLSYTNTTMEDLISAAGGVTSYADSRAYFLEAELTPNNTYYISTKYDTTDVCGSDEIKKVNVNSDDEDELQEISGIGATIAESIINYRDNNGYFYTIEDLLNVSGIGSSKFSLIKDHVILHE